MSIIQPDPSGIPDFGDDPIDKLVDKIQNVSDLVQAYWSLSDAGERLKLFTKLARQKPGVAFVCFKTILLNQADLTLRVITLKSFGELSAFPSLDEEQTKGFIQYLLEEVKSGDSLKRWQTATVLEKLVPPQILSHRELGGLDRPLARVKQDILDQQIQRIQSFRDDRRRNSQQQFLGEYQDYLDFWLYGPVEVLFAEPSTTNNYETIVRDLLAQSPGLLPFGLGQYRNQPQPVVQEAAMDQAKFTFQDQTKQKDLYDLLVWYLEQGQHETDLRIKATEIINTTESWKSSSEKVQVLLKLLLAEELLRQTAIRLLAVQKQTLSSTDHDAVTLLESLQFFDGYIFSTQHNLRTTTIAELTQLKTQAQNQWEQITTTTNQGVQATQVLAQRYSRDGASTRQFLQQQHSQRSNQVDGWLQQLQAQIDETTHKQQIVRSNQQFLQKKLQELRQHNSKVSKRMSQLDLLTNTDYESYQPCQELYKGLFQLKQELSKAASALFYEISGQTQTSSSWVSFNLISGAVIVCLTAVSPSLYQVIEPNSPHWIQQFFQSSGSSSSSSSSSQPESAVAKRFVNGSLAQCGDTSSPNNRWYRVFIPG